MKKLLSTISLQNEGVRWVLNHFPGTRDVRIFTAGRCDDWWWSRLSEFIKELLKKANYKLFGDLIRKLVLSGCLWENEFAGISERKWSRLLCRRSSFHFVSIFVKGSVTRRRRWRHWSFEMTCLKIFFMRRGCGRNRKFVYLIFFFNFEKFILNLVQSYVFFGFWKQTNHHTGYYFFKSWGYRVLENSLKIRNNHSIVLPNAITYFNEDFDYSFWLEWNSTYWTLQNLKLPEIRFFIF